MIVQASLLQSKKPASRLDQLLAAAQRRFRYVLLLTVCLPGALALLLLQAPVFAQPAKLAPPVATASAPLAGKPAANVKPGGTVSTSRPAWAELSALQQQALKPLASSWNGISEAQKRKWLEISKNYPALPPADQATMHSRMNEWVNLSPQQRAQARLNFAKTKELSKQLTPDEKKAKWQSYQSLSAEEKQKLAAKATPKPVGAATAVKPVSPQKLAAVPKSAALPPAVNASPPAVGGDTAPGSAHPTQN